MDLPAAGELNRPVLIREWSDLPNAALGLDATYDAGIGRKAKIEPVGMAAYWGGKQTGEEITHRIWFYRSVGTRPEDLTGQHVIEHDGRRYRVMRTADLNGARRFTLVEAKDLGVIA